LVWYSLELHCWKHEFVPIATFPTKIQCHALCNKLRFLKTYELKDLAREYKQKYNSNYIE
jgi:hypothetical protein